MSLHDGYGSAADRLSALERDLGVGGYDHQRGPLSGWRAERQAAEMRADEGEAPAASGKRGVGAQLLDVIVPLIWPGRRAD